jgi:hypothetical protein
MQMNSFKEQLQIIITQKDYHFIETLPKELFN